MPKIRFHKEDFTFDQMSTDRFMAQTNEHRRIPASSYKSLVRMGLLPDHEGRYRVC